MLDLCRVILFENGYFLEERVDVNSENMWEGLNPIYIFSRCSFGLPTLPFYDPQNPYTSIYTYVRAYNVMQIQNRSSFRE